MPRIGRGGCRFGAETMPQTPADPPLSARRARLRTLIKAHSLLTGADFTLASGRRSGFFFDMKKTMFDPEGASLIAEEIFDMLRDEPDIGFIGGLEMGAVPVVAMVCMRSFPERPLRGFFVRKETKGHGTNALIDGCLESRSKVLLLEDVTTTGGSVMKAAAAVRERGCTVEKVITIVDRLEGAAGNLAREGIALRSIFTAADFAT